MKLTPAQQKAYDGLNDGGWKSAYDLQVNITTLFALQKRGYVDYRNMSAHGSFSMARTVVEFKRADR